MFQPRAKLKFVQRYCSPQNGWRVCVDIDPSEEGRTGGPRETPEALERQRATQDDAKEVRRALELLGATVTGPDGGWGAS